VYLQFYITYLWYYFVAVNYGNLLLQALLEHWWRPPQVDEDTDCQGDQQGTGQTQGGNDYFSVPGHTPVIFRCIFFSTKLCLNDLLTVSKVLVSWFVMRWDILSLSLCLKTSYWDWNVLWFLLAPPRKCWDSIFCWPVEDACRFLIQEIMQ
jgi:hypothetical protein